MRAQSSGADRSFVREETYGVFDRGLRITLVVVQSASFTDVLWCSRCCVIPGERYRAVV